MTFFEKKDIIALSNLILGGQNMSKKLWIILISVVGGVAALTAAVTAFLIFKEKQKRDDEELEHYLDGAIQ